MRSKISLASISPSYLSPPPSWGVRIGLFMAPPVLPAPSSPDLTELASLGAFNGEATEVRSTLGRTSRGPSCTDFSPIECPRGGVGLHFRDPSIRERTRMAPSCVATFSMSGHTEHWAPERWRIVLGERCPVAKPRVAAQGPTPRAVRLPWAATPGAGPGALKTLAPLPASHNAVRQPTRGLPR